jgi:hypothetical protein
MNTHQKAVLDRLVRVQQFLDRHADAIGDLSRSGTRTELDELLRDLDLRAATQNAAIETRPMLTARLQATRRALHSEHLYPIAAVAAASLRRFPALRRVRLPRNGWTDDLLYQTARSFVAIAGEHRHVFRDQCFPEDFVEQLDAAAEALMAVRAEQCTFGIERSSATAEITRLCSRANPLIKALDAVVRLRIRGDAAVMAEWQSVLRLQPPPQPGQPTRVG